MMENISKKEKDLVKEVLKNYGIGIIKNISSPFQQRISQNKLYKVCSEKGEYLLKKIIGKSDIDAKREMWFTLRFTGKFLPEGYIIRTKTSKIGVKKDKGYFILFKFIHGRTLLEDLLYKRVCKEAIKNIAKNISRLHDELSKIKVEDNIRKILPRKNEKLIVDLINALREAKSVKKEDLRLIRKHISEYIVFRNKNKIYFKNIIHGDMSPQNIIMDKKKVYFIDYDQVKFDSRMEDLSFVLLNIWLSSNHLNDNNIRLFIRNYSKDIKNEEYIILLYCIKLHISNMRLWMDSHSKSPFIGYFNKNTQVLSSTDIKRVFNKILKLDEKKFLEIFK